MSASVERVSIRRGDKLRLSLTLLLAFVVSLTLGITLGTKAHSMCARGCSSMIYTWGWYNGQTPPVFDYRDYDEWVAFDNIYSDNSSMGAAGYEGEVNMRSCTSGSFVCYPDAYEYGEDAINYYYCTSYAPVTENQTCVPITP